MKSYVMSASENIPGSSRLQRRFVANIFIVIQKQNVIKNITVITDYNKVEGSVKIIRNMRISSLSISVLHVLLSREL